MRALANGVAVTANWAANALVANTFLSLSHAMGGSGVFWLYASLAACGAVWVLFALPETAGTPPGLSCIMLSAEGSTVLCMTGTEIGMYASRFRCLTRPHQQCATMQG